MTTLYEGVSGIRVMVDATSTYPAWQPDRKITITNTVDGFAATGIFGIPPNEVSTSLKNANQLGSFIWNGVEFCRGPDSGSGTGFELYVLGSTAESTQHQYNAVEPGKLGEVPPLTGSTVLLAQGFTDVSGKNIIRVVKPTFWLDPGEVTSSMPALNTKPVSDLVNTITYTWGLGGDDHIIQLDQSIVIPADPVIQASPQLSMVPLFHYVPNFAPKPFTTQEWVDLATGGTRAYAGGVSTTETLMMYTTDENFACAVVYGDGLLGNAVSDPDRGYRGLAGAGAFPYLNAYGWCAQLYPGGIPTGVVRAPVAFCFGTRADLIGASGAIVTAAANLPAASYP